MLSRRDVLARLYRSLSHNPADRRHNGCVLQVQQRLLQDCGSLLHLRLRGLSIADEPNDACQHRFGADRPLILGGVTIPHHSGLVGHSDGDAVAHAVADALLGAAAMGDLGRLFPDTDARWKDADSMQLLAEVRRRVVAASYTIVNVDVTVVTEAPRLAPHVDAMRERIAGVLALMAGWELLAPRRPRQKPDRQERSRNLPQHPRPPS